MKRKKRSHEKITMFIKRIFLNSIYDKDTQIYIKIKNTITQNGLEKTQNNVQLQLNDCL